MVERVPVKMIIVDGRTAMLPLLAGQHTAPASVLVHASGLRARPFALSGRFKRAYPTVDGPERRSPSAGWSPWTPAS